MYLFELAFSISLDKSRSEIAGSHGNSSILVYINNFSFLHLTKIEGFTFQQFYFFILDLIFSNI